MDQINCWLSLRAWIRVILLGSCVLNLTGCTEGISSNEPGVVTSPRGERPGARSGKMRLASWLRGDTEPQARAVGKTQSGPAQTSESRKRVLRERLANTRRSHGWGRRHVRREREVLRVPVQAPQVFRDYLAGTQPNEAFCPILAANDYIEIASGSPLSMLQAASVGPAAQRDGVPFSGTNLQEAGVNEADRVKFDGDHLFIAETLTGFYHVLPRISIGLPSLIRIGLPGIAPLVFEGSPANNSAVPDPIPAPIHSVRVMVVDRDGPSASEVARIELANANSGLHGLYHLPSEKMNQAALLAVLGSRHVDLSAPSWNELPHTTLDIFDVDDPSNPIPAFNIELDGKVSSSRRLGDRLILVTRHEAFEPRLRCWPSIDGREDDGMDDGEARSHGDSSPSLNLPMISVDSGGPEPLVDISDCFVPASALALGTSTSMITTVTSIDLRNPSDRTSLCLAGTGGTVYASTHALYIAQSEMVAPLRSDSTDNLITLRSLGRMGQRIFKIALDEAGPIYRGNAFVDGTSATSFAMGEHEGVLGVVTTLGRSEHRITLLREAPLAKDEIGDPSREPTLEIVSQLPNEREPFPIGKPGEALRSVRFMGSRVYAVTFKKIDPLYIIDVSNPEYPFISGEVEIPGFSDYLHPIGENLLLGIGKDAFDMGDFAWYQGVKLELFDVSNPATLSSIDSVVVGMRGSQSAALTDHHAVAHLPIGDGHHRFSVPVQLHEGPESRPNTHHPWIETGLFLFEVEESSNPRQSTISHVGAIVREFSDGLDPYSRWAGVSTANDRAVLFGDDVHYIHGASVWSASWFAPEDAIGPQ